MKEDLQEIAAIADEINEQCEELWALAMKHMKISSKEYRDICSLGKKSNDVHDKIWRLYANELGADEIDTLMPRHSVGCCFN